MTQDDNVRTIEAAWNVGMCVPHSTSFLSDYYKSELIHKLRRKFSKSCCCEVDRLLKLLITPFASELHELL